MVVPVLAATSPRVSGFKEHCVGNCTVDPVDRRLQLAGESLRRCGAVFAYVHGSQVAGTATAVSDIDVAAYFSESVPQSFDVLLPPGVDLLVLNGAPLEVAGRIAVDGRVLFETEPEARVRWEAMTRKVYFDELPRIRRAHRDFAESVLRRGG